MRREQVAQLLTVIGAYDNRVSDRLTLEAWLPLMQDVDYDQAIAAVRAHFSSSTDYLMPAHILSEVRRASGGGGGHTVVPGVRCAPGAHKTVGSGDGRTCVLCDIRPWELSAER